MYARLPSLEERLYINHDTKSIIFGVMPCVGKKNASYPSTCLDRYDHRAFGKRLYARAS